MDKINIQQLPDYTDTLTVEIDSLKKQIHRLQLEHDILEKASRILKKDQAFNLQILTNKEKALLFDALRDTYSLTEMLKQLIIPISSYFYHNKGFQSPEKYTVLRTMAKEFFMEIKVAMDIDAFIGFWFALGNRFLKKSSGASLRKNSSRSSCRRSKKYTS